MKSAEIVLRLRDYVIGNDENCIATKRRRDVFERAYTCYSKSNILVSKLARLNAFKPWKITELTLFACANTIKTTSGDF